MSEHPGVFCITHGVVFVSGVAPGTVVAIVGANAVTADPSTLANHMATLKPCLMSTICTLVN